MEFAAPETVGFWHNTFIVPIIVIIGVIVALIIDKKVTGKENEFAWIMCAFVTFIAASAAFSYITINNGDNADEARSQAIHTADSRVTLNSNLSRVDRQLGYMSTLPIEDNKLTRIQLIATESLQTLNCNTLLVEKTYRISCDNPTNGDVTVSVDEALKVLDSKTPTAE